MTPSGPGTGYGVSVFTLLTALWLTLTPASAQSLEDCGALNDLAERALMGALTIRERACLENVGDTSSTEVRNRLGRLLAINAWAKGDLQWVKDFGRVRQPEGAGFGKEPPPRNPMPKKDAAAEAKKSA